MALISRERLRRSLDVRFDVSKVPEITAAFWIIKVLTTGMGEAASDFLVHRWGGPKAVPFGAVFFSLALLWQLSRRAYATWVYWLAVAMVSVFGTMAADVLHIGLGIPYIISSVFFAVVLAAVFFLWQRVERTLSIHSIVMRRRELFYWTTVVTTFALGTAAGDYTARTAGLGYLASTALFAVLFAVPALVFWRTRAHAVFYFWVAYVVTRPLGASAADYLSVSRQLGGVGWGYGTVTLVWTGAIILFVAYLAVTHVDVKPSQRNDATSK